MTEIMFKLLILLVPLLALTAAMAAFADYVAPWIARKIKRL